MQMYTIPADTLPDKPRAVALGFFDGVHIGHRAVIARAVSEQALTPAVFTFDALPTKQLAGELMTEADKQAALRSLGVEEVLVGRFDALHDLSPEAFVHEILQDALHARMVCCGENYRFGKRGAGDVALLRELCAAADIRMEIVPAVTVDGEPVSSTRIRRLIADGDMTAANALLSRPYTIDTAVVGGQHLGRTLGTPTINQPLPTGLVLPKFGVYASAVVVNGHVTCGVTNIGVRPTVGADAPLAETWIPDFAGDLYGQTVPVQPLFFLRPEQRFSSLDALRARILQDGETARRRILGDGDPTPRAVFFDFDDTLQARPTAFLRYADYFLNKYFPALSAEEKAARAAWMLRENNHGYVEYAAYFGKLRTQWASAEPLPDTAALIAEYQRVFPTYTALFDDAVSALTALRAAGWKLGVITNGPSVQQNRKLDISGLRPLLDVAVVSGDEGVHKPDAELFRRAAARLGLGCEACVYVGDHPINDVQGAQTAGMRAVAIDAFTRGGYPADVPIIHSLSELPMVLKAMKSLKK